MNITNGILNFAKVTDNIYRGGQPTSDGWKYLKSIGVTNFVKLNLEHPNDLEAQALGIVLNNCGIDFMDQLLGPVDHNTISNAISSIIPNTYIHCEHGQDRTGLVVACYRYGTGWTKQQSEDEMISMGFHKVLFGLWNFWNNYYIPDITTPVA